MVESTISMVIFNSYVKLPEGMALYISWVYEDFWAPSISICLNIRYHNIIWFFIVFPIQTANLMHLIN